MWDVVSIILAMIFTNIFLFFFLRTELWEKKFWDLYHLDSLKSVFVCYCRESSHWASDFWTERSSPKTCQTLGYQPPRWIMRVSPRKSLYLKVNLIVRKGQQTRLLVEGNNFREMFQYYCISDEFCNYLPIFF